ncbi:cryptochrome DASH [Cordyceps fumosorosea ARSEF 2679]|uniref:Cryptochrome DASH n=1 Tax=Cordyceps fumosorosea (strain ARSEF 2679) TaxID=1081104 RepID=A0A167SWU9_CORFA|nr:cryptochrome DASH [Cordyceps fumosorosea ARSEF 2679]OAA60010.1 cryptochrome DASH [Cordyceps fumosorosea ARSEF 2679]
MSASRVLVYLLRRDLRVSDNPVFHRLATASDHDFTHLLPVVVLPPDQIETSGFLSPGQISPFPLAKSKVGKFWRCGPHRAKFLAEAVWNLKDTLVSRHSGLIVRMGVPADIVRGIIQHIQSSGNAAVSAVWMTDDVPFEERRHQDDISALCDRFSIDFTLIPDEKYYIDDRDLDIATQELPDVFTTYRKAQEPLRDKPRPVYPKSKSHLPPFPPEALIPPQPMPFQVPDDLDGFVKCLSKPLIFELPSPPILPNDAESAHPFIGGEQSAMDRLQHLIKSGAMSSYSDTRNGLLGPDFSTKLSAFLCLGCLTARQIHSELVKFEDGTDSQYEDAPGYGQGENNGTKAIRLELLWRDYMRLCTKKFGVKLFGASGFRQVGQYSKKWKTASPAVASPGQDPSPQRISEMIQRFLQGDTGMGLIDASQRELFLTGYTSNRARQNVASFFAKHLDIDWRYGAEWYECMLIDYDASSNWANWQYVAGVGNDPRGDARIFNPVKQAFDYDKQGEYVRTWIPEVRGFENIENVFQAWTATREELEKLNLTNNIMVTDPLKKIEFTVDRKPKSQRRPFVRGRGSVNGRGGRRGGGGSSGFGRGGMPMPMPVQVVPAPMEGMVPGGLPTGLPMYGAAGMPYDQQGYAWSPPPMGMPPPMHHGGPPPHHWAANAGAPVVSSGWVSGGRPVFNDYNNMQGGMPPPAMQYRGRGNGRGGYPPGRVHQGRGTYMPN